MFDWDGFAGGVIGVTTGCLAHRALQQRLLSEALTQMPGHPSLLGQMEPPCCAQVGSVCAIGVEDAGCCAQSIARTTTTAAIIAVTATIIVFLSISVLTLS